MTERRLSPRTGNLFTVRGRSIQGVLSLIAVGTLAAFVVVFAVGTLALGSVLDQVEKQQIASRVQRARRLLDRRLDTRRHTVQEFAWWTDTWDYIERPRGPEAERFIRENFVDWLPRQYGDRLIAIWARDQRPVLMWTDSAVRGVEATFQRAALFDLLDRRKSVGGFVRTPRGLLLVAAAVVVRSADHTAAGPWRGYLVLGIPVAVTAWRRVSRCRASTGRAQAWSSCRRRAPS